MSRGWDRAALGSYLFFLSAFFFFFSFVVSLVLLVFALGFLSLLFDMT